MASRPTASGKGNRKRAGESLSFEARFRVLCTLLALPIFGLTAALLVLLHVSTGPMVAILIILLLALLLALSSFMEQTVRPLQTLANVVASLREGDYSFRARGAGREDALGELSSEVNVLADALQAQRLSGLEAATLFRRVIAELDAPVLAFDQGCRLRLLNPAAERVFALISARDLGRRADELGLSRLLEQPDEGVLQLESQGQTGRWMIRRSAFRQRGMPHILLLLSDVSAALREEERLAWRRLIRVIGHEISNSLTPIKSIAGSLLYRLDSPSAGPVSADLARGLSVIESRAESLNRFVQAYRQLAQLPSPVIRQVPLAPLLERVARLETRLDVELLPSPPVSLFADADQLEQLLINLVKNAVEAAMHEADEPSPSAAAHAPKVRMRSMQQGDFASILIEDNGPGLANPANLFVPFYTTKKSGTGVGLALARQIAEAHGGTLVLRNRTDAPGCQAEVRIPVASQPFEPSLQPSSVRSFEPARTP
ncbi:sensor histidine kinase [Paracidobacterium acidisoli]|uniref:histidine kinase n=1 Tax=Paracidobacterium acidisoli TaxID=2303751 RepID=A0A372IU29_9BACT|nr:ATP-binding protein [Paracidobacterium acidisoli]MBT9329889.1 ATP-binding protein [Paracidobacterium acidisoli]